MLRVLAAEPSHAYRVARVLSPDASPVELARRGLTRVLQRLERADLVTGAWDMDVQGGPPRRVFTLTPAGRRMLSEDR